MDDSSTHLDVGIPSRTSRTLNQKQTMPVEMEMAMEMVMVMVMVMVQSFRANECEDADEQGVDAIAHV